MTLEEALEYEIISGWLWWLPVNWSTNYYIRKATKKYKRWLQCQKLQNDIHNFVKNGEL